jgi:EAL domain-containing protein (putative c-di-GMP-specific phosphodiesterase class I)
MRHAGAGIIALAHNLGLQIVAEGVETAHQLVLFNTLGCDINQGFFLHRPMSFRAKSAGVAFSMDVPESELIPIAGSV